MTDAEANPLFHVSLGDRDEWVVEAEWPDGTLERVSTFKNHSAAVHWIATTSESWLNGLEGTHISAELRPAAKGSQSFSK
jgi:hypothetical protein